MRCGRTADGFTADSLAAFEQDYLCPRVTKFEDYELISLERGYALGGIFEIDHRDVQIFTQGYVKSLEPLNLE